MKKIALTLAALVCLGTVSAQKNIDIDTEYFQAKYRTTPTSPQNPLFFYYTKELKATPTTKNRVDIESLSNDVTIRGQKLADANQPTLMNVTLNLGDLIIKKSDVTENVSESKDKNGVVTKTYSYNLFIEYTFGADLVITKNGQEPEKINVLSPSTTKVYTSNRYNTRSEAAKQWNDNKDVMVSDFAKNQAGEAVSSTTNYLSSRFGFSPVTDRDALKIMDEKKHPENETMRTNVRAVKAMLEAMTPNQGLNEADMQPYIEYFTNIPTRFTDEKLKADVKLRYIAYYNLCRIYMYLDQPEKAIPFGDALFANGHDKKDGEKLKKDALEVEKILNRTEIKTRHFDPNTKFAN